MKLKIDIDVDTGSAFDGDDRNSEIARILHAVAAAFASSNAPSQDDSRTLRDINGNVAGKMYWTRR